MTRTARTTGIVLAALAFTVSARARAQEPVVTPLGSGEYDQPQLESRWYGWQVMVADAASVAWMVGCVNLTESGACVLTYVAAGPAVHVAHGHPMKALGSAGLRFALPVSGAIIGLAAAGRCHGDDFCGIGEVVGGMLIGTVVASAIDALALSHETVERAPAPRRYARTVLPAVSAGADNVGVGLVGTF